MTKTATKARTTTALTTTLTGKRAIAFGKISSLAYAEEESRANSLSNMRDVLGNAPTEHDIKAAKVRRVIGRVARKLPANLLAKGAANNAEKRLERAELLVLKYANLPLADRNAKRDTTTTRLPSGKLGWRKPEEFRLVRNAEEEASVFFGELGFGKAASNVERHVKKAAAKKNGAAAGAGRGKVTEATPPTHAELVKPQPPVSSDDYVQFMQTQLRMLVDYDAKNAKKRPLTHSQFAEALSALRQVGNAAANKWEERKAAAAAKAKA